MSLLADIRCFVDFSVGNIPDSHSYEGNSKLGSLRFTGMHCDAAIEFFKSLSTIGKETGNRGVYNVSNLYGQIDIGRRCIPFGNASVTNSGDATPTGSMHPLFAAALIEVHKNSAILEEKQIRAENARRNTETGWI